MAMVVEAMVKTVVEIVDIAMEPSESVGKFWREVFSFCREVSKRIQTRSKLAQ